MMLSETRRKKMNKKKTKKKLAAIGENSNFSSVPPPDVDLDSSVSSGLSGFFPDVSRSEIEIIAKRKFVYEPQNDRKEQANVETQETKKKRKKKRMKKIDGTSNTFDLGKDIIESQKSGSQKGSTSVSMNKVKKIGNDWKIKSIFEEAEHSLKEAVKKKTDEVKGILRRTSTADEANRGEKKRKKRPDYEDLSFKKKRVDVDTELLETAGGGISSCFTSTQKALESVNQAPPPKETKLPEIDPNKFLPVKTQKLGGGFSELVEDEDSADDDDDLRDGKNQRMNLMEAFADDDIADEFRKQKEKEEEASKPKTIDLRLPGWGSWGGTGIKPKRQRKQLITLPAATRKDKDRNRVIISDDPPLKFKQQQVQSLPEEFASVAAFEAYVRAPVGTEWVPELAHRALTMPPVVTKKGAIIRPLDESHLLKTKPEEEAQERMNASVKAGNRGKREERRKRR